MEDGLPRVPPNIEVPDYIKNGVVSPIMANFPDGPITQAKETKNPEELTKVNGEGNRDYECTQDDPFNDSYSSESDALVIDESVPKKRKPRGKSVKKTKENSKHFNEKVSDEPKENESQLVEQISSDLHSDHQTVLPNNVPNIFPNSFSDNAQSSAISANSDNVENKLRETHMNIGVSEADNIVEPNQELLAHSNPFFHESLFELTQLHQNSNENSCSDTQNVMDIPPTVNRNLKCTKTKTKPKLKEYAQYLGLQPAVQFKCPKCGKSGFESLLTLQEHFLQCNSVQRCDVSSENENISGFKLTRKVFLCSACGTYYENWNLYMHMLEYHKRYICLYCLGMFSVLEDLCLHIQSRHNLEPGVKDSLEDFYNVYNEPCYVVCCECNQQFNEGDNFFYHKCVPLKPVTKGKPKQIKQVIAPENHVTGDFGTLSDKIPSENDKIQDNDKETVSKECHEEVAQTKTQEIEESSERCVETTGENSPENISKGDHFTQGESDKEMSKNSDSDVTESEDDSNHSLRKTAPPSAPPEGDNCSDIDNMQSKDYLDRDTNNHESEEAIEQDSLDSCKMSGEDQPIENAKEDTEDNENNQEDTPSEPVETRKVPKLSLKLPKPGFYPEPEPEYSDDSDKHDMEVDNIESENENDNDNLTETGEDAEDIFDNHPEEDQKEDVDSEEKKEETPLPHYPVADTDIPVIEIELDQPLDKMDIRILLQKCLRVTVPTCIYCNHSRRIAVNGKQLGLHAIAEHRYSAINKGITEEELTPDSFNNRIKECLDELESIFFSLDSGVSDEAVTFCHVFECFQCHYSTTMHKELYLHNRKFHSKNLLLCIMCKSNFYSYSELICHLCPGQYMLDYDVHFRCCMCVSDDLPSSFRLMVHLRKRHNVCDVCLEMCHNQYKLSNHVWKHKLHHFCYRCGIAYRNKPDITRHLFWKHGTESVLCKKCLQKKWPHVYHFCVPPASFICEECNLAFTRAVSLKVHKRIHTDEKKHACTWEECTEIFISKKLMLKHLKRHTDPPEEVKQEEEEVKEEVEVNEDEIVTDEGKPEIVEPKEAEEEAKPVKPKVDVYDLPELNLSESDSSDSESEQEKPKAEENSTSQHSLETPDEGAILDSGKEKPLSNPIISAENERLVDIPEQPPLDDTSSSVIQNIWDNFKNYQASKEKIDNLLIGDVETKVDQPYVPDIPIPVVEEGVSWQLALHDHDYCVDPETAQPSDTIIEVKPSLESTESIDHDYCFQKEEENQKVTPVVAVPLPPTSLELEEPKTRKRTSSSSSSSSGSDSSCACGSSCSCSGSSSGSSSSSSDSSNSDSSTEEGRKRQQQRRLKRSERNKAAKKAEPARKETESKAETVVTDQIPVPAEITIRESDLETTESETDEEFYDREPQKFARKILEEKRAQLLAEMGPNMVPNGSFIESTSRPPTPPAGTIVEEEEQPKRKKKTKKRKKKKSEKKASVEERTYSATLIMDPEPVVPPPSVPYYQQFHQIESQAPTVAPITLSLSRKNSPMRAPQTPPLFTSPIDTSGLTRQDSVASDSSVRASKRRRVPNKFYGYSSDEDSEKPHSAKKSRTENNRTIPAPPSPKLVPPITIRNVSSPLIAHARPTPTVEPITLRLPKPHTPVAEFKTHRKPPPIPPLRLPMFRPPLPPPAKDDSATESNDSDLDEPSAFPSLNAEAPKAPQPQLYCYCRCPYDEVSEMIGCDSNDCQIEWFHFECVGIMVPPKGQWFCPDCRKKKQQRGLL